MGAKRLAQRSLSSVLRLFGCVWLVACGDRHAGKNQDSVVGCCEAELSALSAVENRAHRARRQKQDALTLERPSVCQTSDPLNRAMKLL